MREISSSAAASRPNALSETPCGTRLRYFSAAAAPVRHGAVRSMWFWYAWYIIDIIHIRPVPMVPCNIEARAGRIRLSM